ncbi:hypothetical protein PIB30_116745 [Stylosanthes scabra]|uniref:Uncharacterized protein n=1 Tax=Stylosanthes scabra TaxID=79078 RepID=A0ABU6XPZ8_9FABA|nr:hypothetical protein [Stylosanthes scabra]
MLLVWAISRTEEDRTSTIIVPKHMSQPNSILINIQQIKHHHSYLPTYCTTPTPFSPIYIWIPSHTHTIMPLIDSTNLSNNKANLLFDLTMYMYGVILLAK